MPVEKVNNYINETIAYIDTNIKMNYEQYKKDDKHDFLNSANSMALGQMVLNKSVFENIKDCLNPKHEIYNCFIAINPILIKLYPNKKDWLPVLGYLLSKARKVENDYKVLTNYLEKMNDKPHSRSVDSINESISNCFNDIEDQESLKESNFLDNIIDENGNFLPYMLNNFDRFMLQAIGMDFNQVALISKKCRSLYKEENRLKEQEQEQKPVKGTRKVNINNIEANIKAKKAKLHYIRTIISVDTYEVIADKMISNEEAANIVSLMQELEFDKDKIEFVKNQIIKFNNKVAANELSHKIVEAKEELFTNEMFDKYEIALTTISDSNMVYSYLKDNIETEIKYIDSIVLDYVNQKENKEDTWEYLAMAFDDLNKSLKLCGPRLIRKK